MRTLSAPAIELKWIGAFSVAASPSIPAATGPSASISKSWQHQRRRSTPWRPAAANPAVVTPSTPAANPRRVPEAKSHPHRIGVVRDQQRDRVTPLLPAGPAPGERRPAVPGAELLGR